MKTAIPFISLDLYLDTLWSSFHSPVSASEHHSPHLYFCLHAVSFSALHECLPIYLPWNHWGPSLTAPLQWQKEDPFIWFSCQNWGLESQEKEDDCSWVITKRKPSENSRTSTLKSSSSSPTVTFQRSRRIKQLLSSVIATQALWCPVSIHQNYKSHLHLQGYFTTKYKTDISFLLLMRD